MMDISKPSRTSIRALAPYRVFIFGIVILLAVIAAYKLMGGSGVLQKMLNLGQPVDTTVQMPANPEQVKSFKAALEESIKITQQSVQSEQANPQLVQNPFPGAKANEPSTQANPLVMQSPFAPAHNSQSTGKNR
jgi:hypothetical protein